MIRERTSGGRAFVLVFGFTAISSPPLRAQAIIAPSGRTLKGTEPGNLNAAFGIAFDSGGRLHEADGAMHRVQMFTAEGKFFGEWFLPNAGNLKVWSPPNLRPANSQVLYVSDVAQNKIYELAIQPKP